MTITSSPSTTSSPSSSSTLHVQLTCYDDPHFLYLCDLTESDFTTMKREQHITVDFSTFPLEIKRLLDLTTTPTPTPTPSPSPSLPPPLTSHTTPHPPPPPPPPPTPPPHYICTLSLSDSTLRIVHLSHFRHVDFLTLHLRPASDPQLIASLITDLHHTRQHLSTLTTLHTHSQAELTLAHDRERTLTHQLTHSRDKDQTATAALYRQHADELAALRAEATREREEAQRRAGEVAERVAGELRARVREVEGQLGEVGGQLERVRAMHAAAVREVEGGRGVWEAGVKEVEAVREEVERVRGERDRLREEREGERVRRVEVERRVVQLEQQVSDAAVLQEKMERLVQGEREQRGVMEESVRVMRERGDGLEARLEAAVAEIHRGNAAIAALQGRMGAVKEKSEKRKRVLLAQERVVKGLEGERRQLQVELGELRVKGEREQAERERLLERVKALERTVDEYAGQLRDNANTIAYLNNRETDKHIRTHSVAGGGGGGGAGVSSRLASLFPASTQSLTVPAQVGGHGGAPFTPASVSFTSPAAGGGGGGGGGAALSSRFYSLSDLSTPSSSQPGQVGGSGGVGGGRSAPLSAPSSSSSVLSSLDPNTPIPIEKRLSAVTRSHLGLGGSGGAGVGVGVGVGGGSGGGGGGVGGVERGRIVGGSVRMLSSLSAFATGGGMTVASLSSVAAAQLREKDSEGKDREKAKAAASDGAKANDENAPENGAKAPDSRASSGGGGGRMLALQPSPPPAPVAAS